MCIRDSYIADVGQGEWEEIDHIPAGSQGGLNFGWDYYEGNHDYDSNGCLLYTSPSPRDRTRSRMPSSA